MEKERRLRAAYQAGETREGLWISALNEINASLVNAAPDLIAAARFGMEAREALKEILRNCDDDCWCSPNHPASDGAATEIIEHRIARAFLDAHPEGVTP